MSGMGYGTFEGPIADVRDGMRVLDRHGEDVGAVEAVKLGDPEAATAGGQEVGTGGGLIENLRGAFAGDDPPVPPEFAEHLLRVGYVKIDPSSACLSINGRPLHSARQRRSCA